MSRKIERIFIHCTATLPTASVESITAHFRSMGWKNPGYHYLIDRQGVTHTLLSEQEVANGVKGYNQTAIHIAYIGGLAPNKDNPKEYVATDTRTEPQRQALNRLVRNIIITYHDGPAPLVLGHRDISPDLNHNGIVDPWERIKECPCFDAKREFEWARYISQGGPLGAGTPTKNSYAAIL